MIKVLRIGHATFETPDIAKAIEHYTQVLGLSLVGREDKRAFLATKIGQLAVELQRGPQARCAKLSFEVAASTDFVDGRLARARNEVSPLGVFMDLTADKVLVAGVLVAMVEVGLLPTWMVATLLIRELVVQGVRQVAASADVVIAARRLGKGKTVTTLLGMGKGLGI